MWLQAFSLYKKIPVSSQFCWMFAEQIVLLQNNKNICAEMINEPLMSTVISLPYYCVVKHFRKSSWVLLKHIKPIFLWINFFFKWIMGVTHTEKTRVINEKSTELYWHLLPPVQVSVYLHYCSGSVVELKTQADIWLNA